MTEGPHHDVNLSPATTEYDVLLWCAKSEEMHLVIESAHTTMMRSNEKLKLNDKNKVVDDANNTIIPGTLTLKSGTYSLILSCGFEQGVESCGIGLTNVLMLYKPKYAVMVGICAAQKDVDLGTVVMAHCGLNFESGKYKSSGDDFKFQFDTMIKSSMESRLRDFMVEYRSQANGALTEPGTMLSGSAVREDLERVYEKAKTAHRYIVGLDMETSAFYNACRVCKVHGIGVFKGVSDNGNSSKGDDMHKKCVQSAVAHCTGFIEHYFTVKQIFPVGNRVADRDDRIGALLDRYERAKIDKEQSANKYSLAKEEVMRKMEIGESYKASSSLWYHKIEKKKISQMMSINAIAEIKDINLSPEQLAAINREKTRIAEEAEEQEELVTRKTPLKRKRTNKP